MPYRIENAFVKAETEKALLIEAEEFDDDTWIPQSQVHDDSEIWKEGQTSDLVIKDWIAEKLGLM